MPRITRRHFLAATLGLPALLLTCGQPDESTLRPVVSPTAQGSTFTPPTEKAAPSTPAPAAPPVAKDPVELWQFAWDDPVERRLWLSIRRQLETDLPHIDLRQEFYQRPVEEMVAVSAAAGLPPEVALIQDLYFPRWVEQNLYVNAQTFVNDWLQDDVAANLPAAGLNAFRFYPEAQRPGVGDFYGLPWRSNPRFLFVNEDMLRQAGVASALAESRWTVETVQRVAEPLSREGPDGQLDQAGIGFPDAWFQSLPWLWSGGGDIIDVASNVSTLLTPEVESTFSRLQAWRHTSRIAPRLGEISSDSYARQFASNKLAMFLGDAGDMFRLQSADIAWQAKPLFATASRASHTLATQDGLAIVTGSQQIDSAWDFISWALGPEVQSLLLNNGHFLPIRSDVIASSQIEPHYVSTLLGNIENLRSIPITATFPLYGPVMAHYYHKMMDGGHAAVPETLRTLHSLLGFILERRTLPSAWL